MRISRFAIFACLALVPLECEAGFLGTTPVDFKEPLISPPTAASAAELRDQAATRLWQKKRTEADCARSLREAKVNLRSLYGAPDGPLTEEELSRLEPFFIKIKEDGERVVTEAKDHWKRMRPFVAMKNVQPCGGLSRLKKSFSYPSGHAADSRLFALVLGQIDPGRAAAFLARADQIAEDRVIAGVHYESDIEAGKKLGELVFQALQRKEAFEAELARLRVK